jgi:hypothetical protein
MSEIVLEKESAGEKPVQPEKKEQIFVEAVYHQREFFAVPVGLDVEDKSIVSTWGVHKGRLVIEFVDETKENLVIDPFHYEDGEGQKCPNETSIVEDDYVEYLKGYLVDSTEESA